MHYDIYFGSQVVGHAQLEKEGLYYRVLGNCEMQESGMYKLQIQNGNTVVKTVTCIPHNGAYAAETRVPVKQLEKGDIHFLLTEKNQSHFRQAEVHPDQEFPYMALLEQAILAAGEEHPTIVIKEAPTEGPQDSDPTPEPDDK